jgi:UDP-N-acetylglucosamine--N-acetylmuramyl-(pentapeptide) pyrophosphoryl-undecaprenol N-acetylglucosamine transferase
MSSILFAAGGTGGHMFPAAAVAENLSQKGFQIHFITDLRGAQYLPENYSISAFNLSRLGRRTFLTLPLAIWQMLVLTLACFRYFIRSRPDRVIGFGGYVTYPVLLCSRIFRVPYFIHEQNSVMGMVNRWFSKGATRVMTSFPNTLHADNTAHYMGLPVRKDLLLIRELPYDPPGDTFKILVLGGSQGASVFSRVVPEALAQLSPDVRKKMVVVQQCRLEDIEDVQKQYHKLGINARLAPFFDRMAVEFAHTHLVITRSGASTMAELKIAGRPGIFVPYPAAMDDHQTSNATDVVAHKAGWLMPQSEFTAEGLAAKIQNFVDDPSVLIQAAAAMKALGKCNATEDISQLLAKGVYDL